VLLSVARLHINRGVIARNYSNGGYTGIKVALSIVRRSNGTAEGCASGRSGQRSILFPRSSLIAFRASEREFHASPSAADSIDQL